MMKFDVICSASYGLNINSNVEFVQIFNSFLLTILTSLINFDAILLRLDFILLQSIYKKLYLKSFHFVL